MSTHDLYVLGQKIKKIMRGYKLHMHVIMMPFLYLLSHRVSLNSSGK